MTKLYVWSAWVKPETAHEESLTPSIQLFPAGCVTLSTIFLTKKLKPVFTSIEFLNLWTTLNLFRNSCSLLEQFETLRTMWFRMMGKEVVVCLILACGRRLKGEGKGFLGVKEMPATQDSLICEQVILSHQDTSLPGKEIIRKPEE